MGAVALFVIAAALVVSGVAVALGLGAALVAAGVLAGLAAWDLSRPSPGDPL